MGDLKISFLTFLSPILSSSQAVRLPEGHLHLPLYSSQDTIQDTKVRV